MIGVEIRFLAGRFHANAWHTAHNEGIAEWPPSPWRLLRSLVSAVYALEIPVDRAFSLIEKLRGLPRYRLPYASDAHTRHYMPDVDDAQHTRAKVFDSFVAVDGGARAPQPLLVAWDADLTAEEQALLDALTRRITYLGRAESWADLRVVSVDTDDWNCWPDESSNTSGTTLLALEPADNFATWVANQPSKTKGRDVPRTLWDVLTFDGERFRKEGWSDIPGTRRARFAFSRPPFQRAPIGRRSMALGRRPTVAQYAIRSPVLPRLREAVSVGDRLRVAAMSRSRSISGDARLVFSGHGDTALDHQHAMYLSASQGHDGFIDNVFIAARAGFDRDEVMALQSLHRVWGRDGHDLDLVLTRLATADEQASMGVPALGTSTVWESLTPFIPTRHPKVRGGRTVDGIADQLARAAAQLLGVAPIEVTPIGEPQEWGSFQRHRKTGGGKRGPDRGYGARLRFAEPVRGPIALGYGAHVGLGMFEAVHT